MPDTIIDTSPLSVVLGRRNHSPRSHRATGEPLVPAVALSVNPDGGDVRGEGLGVLQVSLQLAQEDSFSLGVGRNLRTEVLYVDLHSPALAFPDFDPAPT